MKSNSSSPIVTPLDWMLACAVAVVSLALYIRTLAPGALPGDSGEFQVLAHQLGIAHCPGYPIYLLLARLFTFLPAGDIAYRVNMFSAWMAALTVMGVYLAARVLVSRRVAALLGSLALAVSFSFWSQALIAEIYTSGAAFTTFILLTILSWQKTGRKWLLYVAGFLGGLSLGVHTTVATLAPGIILCLWVNRRKHPGLWWPAIGGVLSGILLWLLALLALDLNFPPANIFNAVYGPARSAWSLSLEDIEAPWTRIWFVVTAQQWRSALDFGLEQSFTQLTNYLNQLPHEFSILTILLILVGLSSMILKHRGLAALFGLSLITHWVISFNYRIWDIYVYYIMGYVLMAVVAAIGLDVLIQGIEKRLPMWGHAVSVVFSFLLLVGTTGAMLQPYLPAIVEGKVPFQGSNEFPYPDHLQAAQLAEAASRTVEQMEPDSIVFTEWDWLYLYYYAAHIEQGRTDIQFVEVIPRANNYRLPDSTLEFIEARIDSQPIFFSRRFTKVRAAGYQYRRVQVGPAGLYQVLQP